MKRQLHELQRRHEQYRKLLQTYHLFGGEAISSSLAPILTLTEQEVQQHEFLKDFQDRLKQLQVSKGMIFNILVTRVLDQC